MEILAFYWPNILAGVLIAAGLGLLGLHIMARNQALEAYVLGQEIQTSIILIAYGLIAFGAHSDHGLHIESFFSLGLAFAIHLVFLKASRFWPSLKMEISLAAIFFFMGLNNFLMSMSPLIEGHMVASLLGDIATASKGESIGIAISSSALLLLYFWKNRSFLDETIEAALFEKRAKNLALTVMLALFMGVSAHIFGLLFTICMLLIGPLCLNIMGGVGLFRSQAFLVALNCSSVALGFLSMNWLDRAPTSVCIVLWAFLMGLISLIIRKLTTNFKGAL